LSTSFTDREFRVVVRSIERRIEIEFDSTKANSRHKKWLAGVKKKVGLGPIEPIPYWSFDTLHSKCVGKIRNTIFVLAKSRKINDQEEFKYEKILLLEDFSINNFLKAIMNNNVSIDFDARTGHNHGTKFRLKQNEWAVLYSKITKV